MINLLDTPGHKDFSEDTYRVLTAVDSVVMVIDAAKGIESQTRKLFEVCRQRGVPIFTFMNKCDRPTRDPLSLLDELESVLGIGAFPVNWPIGTGSGFQGVYDRRSKEMHLFERTVGGQYRSPVSIGGLADPVIRERLDDNTFAQVTEELEVLELAGESFDEESVLAGLTTPVFFGSGVNNFGVQLLLDGFLRHSPPPKARIMAGTLIEPENPAFSGFIFKIQANMDPRHRDRIAFLRVCSGVFERDMMVQHPRADKKVRLSSSHKLFGNERETVDVAYPGDIIGLVGHSDFGIGDTLTAGPEHPLSRDPSFYPGGLRVPAQPQYGQVQAVSPRVGPTPSGGRHPGSALAQRDQQGAVACCRRPAPVRGGPVPAGKRVRRRFASGTRPVDRRALAAAGPDRAGPGRNLAAHRIASRVRYGAEPCGPFPERLVGELLR